MKSLNVLMIAYACDPEGGGEHWLGWGWALEASRSHRVTLFTTSRAKPALEEYVAKHQIELHCLDIPPWVRWLSNFPPNAGAWLRKCWWQRIALAKARKLHAARPFDVVHQTTFHTFRIPFSCSNLGIPSVWGPVAGGEFVPAGFDRSLGQAARSERKRAFLNRLNLKMPWVTASLKRASVILVSNRTTLNFLPPAVHEKCVVMSPNALREDDIHELNTTETNHSIFEILFAGHCAATRAMPLVFDALALGLPVDWHLRIVGTGEAVGFWKKEVERHGLSERIDFTGSVPRKTLNDYYGKTSVLVFPGLRDSGGSALLEAMTLALPILTFDWGGPGEMVDQDSAVLVQVRNPDQTVVDIHAGLCRLATRQVEARRLGKAARARALANFRWNEKWKVVDKIYHQLAN